MAMPNEHLIRQAEIQEALLTRRAEESLRAYVEQAWPILEPGIPFVPNWHIDLICEHLEAITAGEIRSLLITVPPRSMKSLLVSVLWPTWEWIRYPERRWICASHSESLATKLSLDRRAVIQSDWYQARWGDRVQLASDQNVKSEFRNTKLGVMVATSVGGSIVGKGGDRLIVDDLHNPQQVESDVQRETAVTYFRQSLWPRLDNKKTGAMVVVMQRLHEADIAAFCQSHGFVHVNLPAEAEERTEHKFPRTGRTEIREPGDLLWPAREGRAELDQAKRMLGSPAYAAQYQQRPAPAGGLFFQRDWFQFYDDAPPPNLWVLQSWDMAFKGGAHNDFVVGLVAGRRGADIYLMARVKGQWDFRETCREVVALYQKYRRTREVLIEETANGAAVINTLKWRVPGILAVHPDGGKEARAHAAQPWVEAGNVYLPNPRPHGVLIPDRAWVDDFLYQLTAFPHGAHDDDVDAFTQLIARCAQPQPRVLKSFTW
jgi:predicted phage terminase large subunit-like protein